MRFSTTEFFHLSVKMARSLPLHSSRFHPMLIVILIFHLAGCGRWEVLPLTWLTWRAGRPWPPLRCRLYIWDIAPVMPLLKTTGIAVKYLSGQDFDLHQLLDGSPSPEPLVAAPWAVIESMLASIHYKE